MTVDQLYEYLNSRIPRELSCSWDNDGLMCCPQPNRAAKRALVTLDVTDDAVNEAISGGYDLIVSHHPLIFKGLKSINGEDHIASKAIKLIQNGISVFSFHTRLDAMEGGVNDCLAALLGLEGVESFGEEGIGRIGELQSELTAAELGVLISELLGAEAVTVADGGRKCRKIAVLGGEGGDDIAAAISAGADAYISGRLGYHAMTDAPEMGITLIEAGHFYTEQPVCTVLREMITEADGDIDCQIFFSNKIRVI